MTTQTYKPLVAQTVGTLALLAACGAMAEPVSYAIDDAHTYVTFEVGHFGAAVNRGRFDKESGTIVYDKVARSGKIDVTVDTASLYSGSPAFDKHLKSADLFDTAKYPTMRFVADQMLFHGDRLIAVPGLLTLMGKTQRVILKANQFTCYQNTLINKEVCGGDFKAVINRTLFGMNYLSGKGIPDEVKITVTVEAVRQ